MDINVTLKILSFKWKLSIDRKWVQFGIIVAVVLASAAVSYWGTALMLMLIPALLIGIAIFLILIRQINVGFIFILLASMFIPYKGPGGLNAAVIAVAMIISLWLADMFIVKRYIQFVTSRVLAPTVLLLICSVISFAIGQISWFPFANQAPMDAQAGGFVIFILSLGIMLAAAHLIQSVKWLEIIVWIFLGLGAVYVVGRLLYLPVDQIYRRGVTAGSMFWTWLVALSLSQVIFNNKLKRSTKVILLLLVAVTFYVAIVQGYEWKSGWVPPIVVLTVILGLRYPRFGIIALPIALVTAGYGAIQLIGSDEYSWGTRLDAWIIILRISRESPLFGLGFSNYYWYTPLFPIRGWSVNFNSHSQYVDLIAQVGFIGLFSFLWLFFEVGRLSWVLVYKLKDGFARSYVYGVLGGIAGTLVAAFLVDWVLPFVYNIGLDGFRASVLPWIFFGGVIGIEQIYQKTLKKEYRRGYDE